MNCMKDILDQARSQGNCINYLDVIKHFPPDIIVKDCIDDIIGMLNDMGVEVKMENAEIIEFPRDNNDN